jgi:hypothetical protein
MATKRKTAEQDQETTLETATAAATQRQPGDEPAETRRDLGPDPFAIDTDTKVGARLQGRQRYFDRDLGRYAFRRIEIKFDEKPDEQAVIDKIKEAGFEWSREHKAWSKIVPKDEAIRTRVDVERLFQEVTQMLRATKGLAPEPEKTPF